jgi:hypothetical protein
MEQGGCDGQDEVERGSSVCSRDGEAATDGGAKEVIGVRWPSMTSDIHGELPQLEEGEG